MKKIVAVMLITFVMVTFVGCKNSNEQSASLVYHKLSEEEERILELTGNKVLLYEIKNIPKDMHYEISIEYELYKNGEKVKNEPITSIVINNVGGKSTNGKVGINIEENEITGNININGAYTMGKCKIEENIYNYGRGFLENDINLNVGEDVYIVHGAKGKNGVRIEVGPMQDDEFLKDTISHNDVNIFIKLSINEVEH